MIDLFNGIVESGRDDSYLCNDDLSLAEAKDIDDKKLLR